MKSTTPKQGKPTTRRLRLERREAEARARGWTGPWPPEKPRIESAADCEHYLSRLEAGEQRAGFLTALAGKLVAFSEHLRPEHFERFAAVLLDVAENQNAWHRSRLRAAQAASRLLRLGLTVLPKLGKVGASVPRAHLEALLAAFCRRLSGDGFRRLAKALADLTGPAAKTTGDKLRTVKAVLATVTDTARILPELDAMRARCEAELDENSPETLRVIEQVRREIAEIDAQIVADRAHNSRGG